MAEVIVFVCRTDLMLGWVMAVCPNCGCAVGHSSRNVSWELCTKGRCALCTEELRASEPDLARSWTHGRYTHVHHSLELHQLFLPWSLVCAEGSGCWLGGGMCLERCSHLLVVQCFWESSTLGPMCLVSLGGSALLFLTDGAQALEEGSFRYWKGGCMIEGKG